jgi:catechol 2,3-dioxygenase-like lactoylglutathione lyase family enzyme
MIDHVGIQCRDIHASARFYDSALGALGGRRVMEHPTPAGPVIGYGTDAPEFWISPHDSGDGFSESHIAFHAASADDVIAFRDAAVGVGAEVLHEPRMWPEYHPGYFGAFVRDPDGNNVEAVCHGA